MRPPLTLAEAVRYHDHLLTLHGGTPGLRDQGGLESALSQPEAAFFGEVRFPSPVDQAAAYLYYVISAHAFVDGNKRTAGALGLIWLTAHDVEITSEDAYFDLCLDVARGQLDIEQTVDRLGAIVQRTAAPSPWTPAPPDG